MLVKYHENFLLCFFVIEYYLSREGIDWTDIEWVDNAECLDLIEKVGYKDYRFTFIFPPVF